jgi:hypothetical protein
MAMNMEFPSTSYRGEYLAYDGNAVTVRNIAPGVNSPLANFIYRYDRIMKNGLLGGVYSNAWPLLNNGFNKANMRVRKTRVERTELYELEYHLTDRHDAMRIRLYFDPETWRHVRTHYYLSNIQGFNPHPTLTEKFDNFKEIGELTLPHSYAIHLEHGDNIAIWKIEVSEWTFNALDIDQRIFQAE